MKQKSLKVYASDFHTLNSGLKLAIKYIDEGNIERSREVLELLSKATERNIGVLKELSSYKWKEAQ